MHKTGKFYAQEIRETGLTDKTDKNDTYPNLNNTDTLKKRIELGLSVIGV